jgi:molybdopterin synthase sulfur carrier subunit
MVSTGSVQVTVLIPGVLRAECGGAAHLQVSSGPDLGALLDELQKGWPRLHRRVRDEQGTVRRFVNIYVDGEDCRELGQLAAPLREGSEVQILPSVAGG